MYDPARSSIRTCSRARPAREASANAIANGVDLLPGDITTSVSPHLVSPSVNATPYWVHVRVPVTKKWLRGPRPFPPG